eukprot:gnl/Ergobibamus_cyprinoides/5105.p3 GENE.gnl/Ergobibamus_cyprinoides/5105~~gnl/Ergobibamus_cyprinoides/5105.p3  ORF type:complete len:134 (+),score=68.44 gnl/Ergobibamus_cyprinoides/5105:205-606(+)
MMAVMLGSSVFGFARQAQQSRARSSQLSMREQQARLEAMRSFDAFAVSPEQATEILASSGIDIEAFEDANPNEILAEYVQLLVARMEGNPEPFQYTTEVQVDPEIAEMTAEFESEAADELEAEPEAETVDVEA